MAHVKPVIVNGVQFPTLKLALETHNQSHGAVHKRLSKGWSLDQAFEISPPPAEDHKSYNLWLRKQGLHRRVCSRCKIEQSLNNFYSRPVHQTGNYHSECKTCVKEKAKWRSREISFGLSENDWKQLFASQGFCCAVCKTDSPQHTWHTDHCHHTGKVRGILCRDCNLMLGFAKDNPATLVAAIQYLEEHMDLRAQYEKASGNTVIENIIYDQAGHQITDYSDDLAREYLEFINDLESDDYIDPEEAA